MGGCIGVRNVSSSRGSANAIFLTCAIYAVERQWFPTELKTLVGIHRFAVSPGVI